jgi:hypothetical protein
VAEVAATGRSEGNYYKAKEVFDVIVTQVAILMPPYLAVRGDQIILHSYVHDNQIGMYFYM